MSDVLTTPGYVWTEVAASVPILERPSMVDLKDVYPIPGIETLQNIWDKRETETIIVASGAEVTTTVFNKTAENGAIFWLPGWGVSNLKGGGARVATLMAAMNPDKLVIAGEELVNVPARHKQQASLGYMGLYASNYMDVFEKFGVDVLSGHSGGGLIHAELAKRADIKGISVVNLMDLPRARGYMTTLGFGLRVGLLDNLVQGKYADLVDRNEEEIIKSFGDIPSGGGAKEALYKAIDEWWLLRAMARSGLQEVLGNALWMHATTSFFMWHGGENVGAPVEDTRRMVRNLRQSTGYRSSNNLRYFESPTGHYSEGHTARYPRQTTYAIDHAVNR